MDRSARLPVSRDFLLLTILLVNLFLAYLLLSQQSVCSLAGREQPATQTSDPQLAVKLREFIKTLGTKLEWDVDSKLTEIEGLIQNFQKQQSLQLTLPSDNGTLEKETAETPALFSVTANVVNCKTPSEPVKQFSQEWARGGTYLGCHESEWLSWARNLSKNERKIFSQQGEDGITEAIVTRIGEGNKFFVEFGVQNGEQCNTRMLRERRGWKGIMFDNGHSNHSIGLYQTSVWVNNILELFVHHDIPKVIDFLSIDTDFGDFWLLEKLLSAGYRPRAFVIEINNNHGPFASLTVPLERAQAHDFWRQNKFFGVSVLALYKLANKYGYDLVYVDKMSVNAFFIKRSEMSNINLAQLEWSRLLTSGTTMVMPGKGYHKVDDAHQPFVHICSDVPCESSRNF